MSLECILNMPKCWCCIDCYVTGRFITSLLLQVLNHLHKKLKNVSKKSELSKKKVGGSLFLSLYLADVVL